MADKYIRNSSGTLAETEATVTSAGAGNAGDIVALDAAGKLDPSVLPTGIGADVATITTSEALSAGSFVNIHDSSGAKARLADASTSGKEAHGFVKSAFGSGAPALVYFEGPNDQVTGATPGVVYLSDSVPGGFTSTAPAGTGKVVQKIGVATSSTAINFEGAQPIILA